MDQYDTQHKVMLVGSSPHWVDGCALHQSPYHTVAAAVT